MNLTKSGKRLAWKEPFSAGELVHMGDRNLRQRDRKEPKPFFEKYRDEFEMGH